MTKREAREHTRWILALLAIAGCAKPELPSPAGDATSPAPAGGEERRDARTGNAFVLEIPPDAAAPDRTPALSADGRTCGITTHGLARVPPEILLVLDRSPSMIEEMADGPACRTRTCGTRWDEVIAALSPALTRTQAGINWGLKTYPDDAACLVRDGATVPVAPDNADLIIQTYTANPPVTRQGYTPTREAIARAAAYLHARQTSNPKSILLATDGQPNCALDSNPGRVAPEAAVQEVAEIAAAGIFVYVVGVATAATQTNATLDAMAVNGGKPRAGSPRYYAVDTAEDLGAAMDAIAAVATTCTFSLAEAPPVPDNVAVEVDGQRVPRDTGRQDGWDYGPGMASVEFHGPTCERIKAGGSDRVSILFGCPFQPIP